jgi:Ca2+-binding EF-hand superfamily protein
LSPAELRQALALAGFNTVRFHFITCIHTPYMYIIPLHTAMRIHKYQGTDFVEEIMEEFDTDGDGMMDVDEFRVMLHVLYTGQRSKGLFGMIASMLPGVSDHAIYQNEVLTDKEIDMYKKVFNDADESGDMLLDEGELQFLLVKSGFIFGQREFVYEAMRNMDTSGDGAVDFGEFLVFMAKIKTRKLENDSWL